MSPGAAAGVQPRGQVSALTRTFLARFFDNEITSGTNDLKDSFFWLISFLAAPGICIPVLMSARWTFVGRFRSLELLREVSRADKTLYLAGAMVATGILTVIVWSSLLVDRRDGLVLGTMPVRSRTIVWSKLRALAAYVSLVVVGMHAAAAVLFGLFLAVDDTLDFVARGVAAHFVASSMASLFVFACIIAVQGTSLVLLGPRVFARLSGWLQLGLVSALILGLIGLPALTTAVVPAFRGGASGQHAWILNTPPLWFLGVYESVLGTDEPILVDLARGAALALAAALAVAGLSYPLAYKRVMRDAVERSEGPGQVGWLTAVAGWLATAVGRNGVARATAQFVLATVARVERHRFAMALTAGAAVAWAVPTIVRWQLTPGSFGATHPLALTALPIATVTLLLAGLRVAIALPADLKSAWLFDVAGSTHAPVRSALRRGMLALAVVPVVAGAAPVYVYLWGPAAAIKQSVVCLAIGALIVEYLVSSIDAMPCTTPWRPGNANLRLLGPVYVLAFAVLAGTGAVSVSALALAASESAVGYASLVSAIGLATASIRWTASRRVVLPAEEPDGFSAVQLNLN